MEARVPSDTRHELRRLGHDIRDLLDWHVVGHQHLVGDLLPTDVGRFGLIQRDETSGALLAAADARGDGVALAL
jgi:hypothetical protein